MLRAAESESTQNLAIDSPALHIGSLQFSWSCHMVRSCSHPVPFIVLAIISLKLFCLLPINASITEFAPEGTILLGTGIIPPPSNMENLSKSTSSGTSDAKNSTGDGGVVL